MKGNKNMEKQKRITLNADKRKVIADVFQNHFEDNSKFKKAWQNAKDKYVVMRNQAKTIMDKLIRKHQPQEDVDTIRSMISKYKSAGGDLYHDDCFYVQTDTPKMEEQYDVPITQSLKSFSHSSLGYIVDLLTSLRLPKPKYLFTALSEL